MQRRRFLGAITLGAGATTLPMWLSRSFNLDHGTCPEPHDLSGLGLDPEQSDPHDCRPGHASPGRPQLVLVIPADRDEQYRRGHAFGELLNAGRDDQLAPLACFDVVCRRLADLKLPAGEREPWMVVLAPDQPPRAIDGLIVFTEHDPWSDDVSVDARIDARIAALADLIAREADGPRLVAQACSERASLPPADLHRLEQLPDSLGELQPGDVDRAPATALLAARGPDPEIRRHLHALLAATVRARLCDRPIDGAPWARATGCGVEVEGEPDSRGGIMCGMGHTNPRSARFLKFYVSR